MSETCPGPGGDQHLVSACLGGFPELPRCVSRELRATGLFYICSHKSHCLHFKKGRENENEGERERMRKREEAGGREEGKERKKERTLRGENSCRGKPHCSRDGKGWERGADTGTKCVREVTAQSGWAHPIGTLCKLVHFQETLFSSPWFPCFLFCWPSYFPQCSVSSAQMSPQPHLLLWEPSSSREEPLLPACQEVGAEEGP